MKPNQSRMITILVVALVVYTGLLLSGCASIGDEKEAGAEMESSGKTEQQSAAGEEAGGSPPELRTESVANTAGSGEKHRVSDDSVDAGGERSTNSAAYLLEALERILPGTLPELNWNRIATVVVGLLIIAMIYGLAFALGRLPARRRSAAGRGGGV